MNLQVVVLGFYGIFLIICGIASVLLIGPRAKTALLSGGLSGAIALVLSWRAYQDDSVPEWAALALPLLLFVVFCWRSAKTLFAIFDLIPKQAPELKGKGIAFLVISLMAVISLVVLLFELVIMNAYSH